ncbi:hypothetical protein [Lysobacter enzymogenes]
MAANGSQDIGTEATPTSPQSPHRAKPPATPRD